MKLNNDKNKMIEILKKNNTNKEKERQKFLKYTLKKIKQNKELLNKED